jgi:hypothetical protein
MESGSQKISCPTRAHGHVDRVPGIISPKCWALQKIVSFDPFLAPLMSVAARCYGTVLCSKVLCGDLNCVGTRRSAQDPLISLPGISLTLRNARNRLATMV